MLDAHTKKDIDKISYDILKSSKSWGKFPTPVDQIIQFTEIMIDKQMDVSQIHHGYLSRAPDALRKALSKIVGIFDRSQKTMYLDLSQNGKKQNFVKLHETGHGVLPWQNATTEFLDDRKTLSEEQTDQFEAEANYFASGTLFQLERFQEELLKLEFGIKSAMALSTVFGSSIHSAIRRYVEQSTDCCALLVLNEPAGKGVSRTCGVRNYFQSTKFDKKFGPILWPAVLDSKLPFVLDYVVGRKLVSSLCTLVIDGEMQELQYDFFNSTYNAFVLIYPKGTVRSGKTKIIIQNSSL